MEILIIMKSKLPRYKRFMATYKLLAGIFIPKYIIVFMLE